MQGSSVPPSLLLKAVPPPQEPRLRLCQADPLGAEPFPRASCSSVRGPFAITRGPLWARLLCLESLPGGRQLSGICHLGSGRPGSHPGQLAWSPHLPPHPTSPCPSGSVSDSSYGLVFGGQGTSTGTLKCPAQRGWSGEAGTGWWMLGGRLGGGIWLSHRPGAYGFAL